jgi:type II secretory pathway component PulF
LASDFVSMFERNRFCPEWSWWLRAGERLSLGINIRIVLGQTGPPTKACREGISRVMDGIREGQTVCSALRASGLELPSEAWSLLEGGEVTGGLGEAMIKTGDFLRNRERQHRAFWGQLWYPLVVVLMGAGVMAIILLWVVPQLREVSASLDKGAGLPWITRNIGWLYASIFSLWVLAGAMCAALWPSCLWWARRSVPGASFVEELTCWIPLVGWMRRCRREARLARQVGTLLHSGVTLPRALEMASDLAPDLWEKRQLLEFRSRLIMGSGLDEALEVCPLIQPESRGLLLAGQESGKLDHYLIQVADDLEGQAERKLAVWTRALEPVLLLLLAVMIGGLILAYILPMTRLLEQLA